MSADFFCTIEVLLVFLVFSNGYKSFFHKCKKMTEKCFKAVDCFKSLHYIVASGTWLKEY